MSRLKNYIAKVYGEEYLETLNDYIENISEGGANEALV